METTLSSDDFYVDHPTKGEYFSLAGIQFLTELIAQAVVEAGWDPAKVSFGMDSDVHMWIGYPSASTKVIKMVAVEDGMLLYEPRYDKDGKVGNWASDTEELPLADPNLAKNLAAILMKNLPKNSKFAKK